VEEKLAEVLGEPVSKASAAFVRSQTGFATEGLPPVAHDRASQVFLDDILKKQSALWVTAGTPRAVFWLTPAELERITSGCWITIA